MNFTKVFVAELKRVFSDSALVLTIIGGVLLYAFLYPQPYLKQSVSSLPVGVVDLDNSHLSREITHMLQATPNITIKCHYANRKSAKEALAKSQIKAIVFFPYKMEQKAYRGEKTSIEVGVDNSYFLIFGAVMESALKTILTQSTIIKITQKIRQNASLPDALTSSLPFSVKPINLFNPEESYTQYIIPAVFILILQQTLLIGLGILGGGINESLAKKERFYYRDAPLAFVILSRLVIFGVIFFTHLLLYTGFMFEFYEIKHIASIEALLVLGTLFIVAVVMFGNFLGALFSFREVATPVVLFSSLPLVFSVGFVWPKENIPEFVQQLSLLAPSTPAISAYLKLNQMGSGLSGISHEAGVLALQIVVYAVAGYLIMRWNVQKYKEHP